MIKLSLPYINSSLQWTKEELIFLKKYKHAKAIDIFNLTKKGSQRLTHQIFSKQGIDHKLPFLFANDHIVYPPTLSLEQSSSEITAQFKASLFSGKSFLDLSGGFGIDSYHFAKQFEKGIIVERNFELAEITSHNFYVLNQMNVEFAMGIEAEEFLHTKHDNFDLIYIDPARRNEAGNKVAKFSDSEPNVLQLLPSLFKKTKSILIKASPLLDIHLACEELQFVKNVYVLATENECKELLFHLEVGYQNDYEIHTVNFEKEHVSKYSFYNQNEKNAVSNIGEIKKYLYEPNSAILKSGGFKSIAHSFEINKIHPHSHLYTSDEIIPNFPGRNFEVHHVTKADRKLIKQLIPEMKANVSIRNFPGSVKELKEKLGLKDGGEIYVFGTTNFMNHKVILITRKINPNS